MPNNITPPRVPMVDIKNGLITREWYQFFFTLFNLTGAGQEVPSLITITEDVEGLQGAPSEAGLTERVAELTKAVQGLQEAPLVPPDSGIRVTKVTATLDFPNTLAGACSDLTVTVPGAMEGDVVCLAVPNASVPANGVYFAWVSAADTVTVRFSNPSAGALNPASGLFTVVVTRY